MSAILALIAAVFGAVPAIRKPREALVLAGVYFGVAWWLFYGVCPSLAWPFGGALAGLVVVFWVVSAIAGSLESDRYGDSEFKPNFGWVLPITGVLVLMGSGLAGCSMLRSDDYKAMIGSVGKKVWTEDVQPADARHVRLVPLELAYYLATKQLGEVPGAIGSQFEIDQKALTLQMVKGELWYVAPLDFRGFRTWTSAEVSPGYVMVHGEDPKHEVVVKTGESYKYLNSAWFGSNLERLLWKRYGTKYVLSDFTFEVDESGKAWYTVTASKPRIVWWGLKAEGVIVVDPTSGQDTFYAVSDVPIWIDRVVPWEFVRSYITWNGKYQHGWLNSVWGSKNNFEPGNTDIAYGADGDPYWVTDLTSVNGNDKSMIGLVYTDCRTGASTMYQTAGGTEDAVIELVNNKVLYRKLHGRASQLYNIYGTMTAVVPVLGESHSFQGVALVNVAKMQEAVGDDVESALRQYQKMLALSGQQVAPEVRHDEVAITGKVSRFAAETRGGETQYYLCIEKVQHIFVGGDVSPKLRLTLPGDTVLVGFIESNEDVVPIVTFDNPAIALTQSAAQTEMRDRVAKRETAAKVQRSERDVRAEVENLSPAELNKLLELRKQK